MKTGQIVHNRQPSYRVVLKYHVSGVMADSFAKIAVPLDLGINSNGWVSGGNISNKLKIQ